jgi:hypothetical protein
MIDGKPIEIVDQSETHITVEIPKITKISETREFRIKATTNGGAVAYTDDIKIKKFNCENDIPIINYPKPLIVKTPTQEIVGSIFESLDPIDCPINFYKIFKIINNSTGN